MRAFLKAIRPLARCSSARWLSSFFDQRMRTPRLRFSQEWHASATQRRAFQSVARLEIDLLAASADVRLEALRDDQLADVGVVVAAIQAQALRLVGGGDRPRDRKRGEGVLEQHLVVPVGAVVGQPDRDPRGLGQDRAFRPLLARSVGFGPVLGPPSGALVIAPSQDRNDQSIPILSSYSSSPWRQNSSNTPAARHS